MNLFQKYQLKLVTVFQNRANFSAIKIKEALSQNLLGRPILFLAKFYWSRDQRYYNLAEDLLTLKILQNSTKLE